MGKFLRLEAGKLKSYSESGTPTIYNDYYLVKASGASGPNEINESQVTSGTPISLPNSGNYTGAELIVQISGQGLRPGATGDYQYVGSGTRTQISLNFSAKAGDEIRFSKYRNE